MSDKLQAARHSIELGAKYPFDATDAWWRGPTTQETPPGRDWNHRAARGILHDLCDRRQIKNGFDGIDENIRADIVDSIAAIIGEAFDQSKGE